MCLKANSNDNFIVPIGTQVVTRYDVPVDKNNMLPAGSVGVITKVPTDNTHSYRLRFADEKEISLVRQGFAIRKKVYAEGLIRSKAALRDFDLYDYVIYSCVVGSRAFGLSTEESDVDRRGIYLPPAEMHWSLSGVPQQLEDQNTDECYWELQKFLVLALKANPNILECLYTPIIEKTSPLAEELRDMKEAFLSKLVYQTYRGYVISQFRKLEGDIRNKGAIKWKHAMHLIRLLLSGITALREGHIKLNIESERTKLLAIRAGEMPWDEVNAWRIALQKEFEHAFAQTTLPDYPDYARANAFLIKARRSMVK